MYSFDWADDLRTSLRRVTASTPRQRVAANVLFLGVTSLLTDISSEMIASILPLYLVLGLGLSPFAFGLIDGLYPGVTALVRWGGGMVGDRTRRHKELAATGYALSAATRPVWLIVGSNPAMLALAVTVDRIGKGLRTAPRDALISLSTPLDQLAGAFGVHRTFDAAGAMLGPLVAFALLAAAPARFDLVFVASLCTGIVGLSVLLLFVRNPVRSRNLEATADAQMKTSLLCSDRRLWVAMLATAGLSLVTISDGFVYLTLQQHGHLAPALLPLMYVGTSCSYLLLAMPFGFIADRMRRWMILLAGHAFIVLLYLLLLRPALSTGGVILAIVLLGSYYAATDGVMPALASTWLPQESRGAGLGLLATAVNIARLGASIVFGWTWSVWGSRAAVLMFAAALPVVIVASGWGLARAEAAVGDE